MIKKFQILIYSLIVIMFLGCSQKIKFTDAKEAFDHKYFHEAVRLASKEIDQNALSKENKFEKLYLIATSYKNMNNPDSAIFWFNEASKIAYDEALGLNLSKEYKKKEMYKEAIETIQSTINEFGSSPEMSKELAGCKQAILWKNQADTNVVIEKLYSNNGFSRFVSDIYKNNSLIISSDEPDQSQKKYGWTDRYFYDLYLISPDKYSKSTQFPLDINTPYNESSATFDNKYEKCYFVRCGEKNNSSGYCHIYFCRLTDGKWTVPERLVFQKDNVNYVSPRLSPDGNRLFFSSEDAPGSNSYDIYSINLSKIENDIPTSLPNYINTPGNENFVTFDKDTMYFSSDFLSGMGGYDLFYTVRDSNGIYSPPQHLKCPINSGGDDFNYIKVSDTLAYFNTTRFNTQGLDEIFKAKYNFGIAKMTINEQISDSLKLANKKLKLILFFYENVFNDPDNPNSRIIGRRAISDVSVRIGHDTLNFSDKNGYYSQEIKFDTIYNIVAGKKDFLTSTEIVRSDNTSDYNKEFNEINFKIRLDRLYLNKEITLKNIYYDFDSWILKDESMPTLNMLYQLLTNNPDYKVNIGSHTDCRGTEDYNLDLSQKRAESVVNFLVEKGISKDRLLAKGYGEENLINKCKCEECTENQHQENRRTTFELMK